VAASTGSKLTPSAPNAPVSQELLSGERTCASGQPITNRILLAVIEGTFRNLRPHIEFVELPQRLVLHEPNQKLEFAYFPNSGMISLVVVTANEKTVEVGMVGKEGVTAMPAAVGFPTSPLREIVQIEGEGFRVPVDVLRETVRRDAEFRLLLTRYCIVQGMHIAQNAACNRLHSIEQRLARWLLMTQDRVEAGLVPITHDFLATMLGTDRPSVGLAASSLQKKGSIEYRWGSVKIVNRKALESESCECYAAIQQFNANVVLPD
jgi:CRP-like cAMP-binding protein